MPHQTIMDVTIFPNCKLTVSGDGLAFGSKLFGAGLIDLLGSAHRRQGQSVGQMRVNKVTPRTKKLY